MKTFGQKSAKSCPSGTHLFPLGTGSCFRLTSRSGMLTTEAHIVRSSV